MPGHSIHTTYRPLPLILCLLSGFGLWASWFLLPSRAWWSALDHQWFYLGNGSLAEGHGWQIFWAMANHRAFDALPSGMLLGLFGLSAWRDYRNRLNERFAIGIFMALYCVAFIQLVRLFVLEPRMSPTLVLPDAQRLSELVPHIHAKDHSTFSFPGDHATVMCIVASFIWYFCGRKYGIPPAVIVGLFVIPRTVGGAHWLTDVLVAAPAITLAAIALALATPLAGRSITAIRKYSDPLFDQYLRKFLPRN